MGMFKRVMGLLCWVFLCLSVGVFLIYFRVFRVFVGSVFRESLEVGNFRYEVNFIWGVILVEV